MPIVYCMIWCQCVLIPFSARCLAFSFLAFSCLALVSCFAISCLFLPCQTRFDTLTFQPQLPYPNPLLVSLTPTLTCLTLHSLVLSWFLLYCFLLSCFLLSCFLLSRLVSVFVLFVLALLFLALPCLAFSCLVSLSFSFFFFALSCLTCLPWLPFLILSCFAISCQLLPCQTRIDTLVGKIARIGCLNFHLQPGYSAIHPLR
jgi:hypothetical protein